MRQTGQILILIVLLFVVHSYLLSSYRGHHSGTSGVQAQVGTMLGPLRCSSNSHCLSTGDRGFPDASKKKKAYSKPLVKSRPRTSHLETSSEHAQSGSLIGSILRELTAPDGSDLFTLNDFDIYLRLNEKSSCAGMATLFGKTETTVASKLLLLSLNRIVLFSICVTYLKTRRPARFS